MRRLLLSLCIITQCIVLLQAINLYILYSNLDQYSLDFQAFKDDWSMKRLQYAYKPSDIDSEEGGYNIGHNNNEEHNNNNINNNIQMARVAIPVLPKASSIMESKHSVHIRTAPADTTVSPLSLHPSTKHLSSSSSSQFLPPITSDCDAFYSHEFNGSYNPEHYGGIEERYKVSICTKVKNEAKYIEEWLLYYWLVLRVSHFYVYDDGSEDDLKAVLQPYIRQGLVTYIYWNQNKTVDDEALLPEPQFTKDQRFCVADCTTKYKAESEWMAFWDVDEFVYLPEGHDGLPDLIDTYVASRGWDNVLIPWAVFGASNHSDSPTGFVINNYRWRHALLQFGVNKAGGRFNGKVLYKSKCIPLAAVHLEDMTSRKCVKGDYPVRFDRDLEGYPIHMKHYWSKSFQDYRSKLGKWQNAHWFRTELAELEELAFGERMEKEGVNSKYDVDMVEFVPRLTHALECVQEMRREGREGRERREGRGIEVDTRDNTAKEG